MQKKRPKIFIRKNNRKLDIQPPVLIYTKFLKKTRFFWYENQFLFNIYDIHSLTTLNNHILFLLTAKKIK